jgi:hypothetical protein
MCQVYLPYNSCDADVYEVSQGALTMRVQAAKYIDKDTKKQFSRGIPYGTRARLLIYRMNELAVEGQSRTFLLAKNFSQLTRDLGMNRTGREMGDLKRQLERLITASFSLQWDLNQAKGMHNFHLVETFIMPRRLKGMDYARAQKGLEGFSVTLSQSYFESLVTKAVPLDKRAIAALQNNPMALDIYTWLTQRLHRIKKGHPNFIAWSNLHSQFGRGYAKMHHFKPKFRKTLQDVRLQYPGAKLDEVPNKGFNLHHSPPPVAPKTRLVF